MDSKPTTAQQAHRFLLVLGSLVVALVMASFYFDFRSLDEEYQGLATEMGRSFFEAIDAMRDWNLKHGGIYVTATDDIQPNQYLAATMRDVLTNQGRKLVMINHAQMTRLISELLTDGRGIHIHITSLDPVRPGNAPDSWERQALTDFGQGRREAYGVTGETDKAVFRFMAPLKVTAECLSCHPPHDGLQKSARGGISVSFSYAPFLNLMRRERITMILIHAAFLVLGLGILVLTGGKLIQSIEVMQDSLLHIKKLEGLLPICAHCKKIRLQGTDRVDPRSWVAIEKYIEDRTDASFSHGLCPTCAKSFYPEYFRDKAR